jgi:hypothetical protein
MNSICQPDYEGNTKEITTVKEIEPALVVQSWSTYACLSGWEIQDQFLIGRTSTQGLKINQEKMLSYTLTSVNG